MQATQQTKDLAEIQKISFSGRHILIADDEPINLMVTAKMLIAREAFVSKASNGYELLKLLEQGIKPDLILLDIKMPELDGYCTIKKIKQNYSALTVLAFTASFIDEETEIELKQNGFYGSLPKTFKPNEFYSRIAEALNVHLS